MEQQGSKSLLKQLNFNIIALHIKGNNCGNFK